MTDIAILSPPSFGREPAVPLSDESEAALRQLTLQRLMGYSVEYGDAGELRKLVELGVPWKEAARAVADVHLARSNDAGSLLSGHSRRDLLIRISALLRMSQMMMLSDTEERRDIYRRASKLFLEAFTADPNCERVTIDAAGKPMIGWLAGTGRKGAPSVLIIGGIEGWGMDLLGLGEALQRRGIDALLLDGPGQGETRFDHGHFLDDTWPAAYSAAITFLIKRSGGAPVGVLGNSVGGGVAMKLAAIDRRIAACCNNGGLRTPMAQRERKGFFPKVVAFCGGVPAAEVERIWRTVEIVPGSLGMTCPLLIVHGGLDPLVSTADVTEFLGWATSPDKQLRIFADGDHCIYNHPADKHDLIGDWFLDRLARRRG
jgi:alpha-beta hydrolase superfamily lysophospholipase